MKYAVEIEGIAPLLQCYHPTPEQEAKITKITQGTGKKRQLTEAEMYAMHAYKTPQKKYYQPSTMIEAAMLSASKNYKVPNARGKSYYELVKGGILVEPIQILHKEQKENLKKVTHEGSLAGVKGWYVDARWGTNEHTGGAVWVVRPRIDSWKLAFTVNVLQDERITGDLAKEFLTYAGLYVGIGAWRPKFGRFKVNKFQATK